MRLLFQNPCGGGEAGGLKMFTICTLIKILHMATVIFHFILITPKAELYTDGNNEKRQHASST